MKIYLWFFFLREPHIFFLLKKNFLLSDTNLIKLSGLELALFNKVSNKSNDITSFFLILSLRSLKSVLLDIFLYFLKNLIFIFCLSRYLNFS